MARTFLAVTAINEDDTTLILWVEARDAGNVLQ
jgi:hypothetical protein